MADLDYYLRSVKLPAMPEVANALIHTLNNPNADVTTVHRIIAKDPALTASLLRMANSAMFGLSREVSSLEKAINVVGMAQIRARALSIVIAKTFTLPQGMNRLELWRYCMTCAGYARWLARHANIDEQQAWLTAVLMRLGEIVMIERNPDLAEYIEKRPCAPGERWARERTLTGFDEGQITAALVSHWDFPESVSLALSLCAQPLDATPPNPQACVLHLAALLADLPSTAAVTWDNMPPSVLAALGLDSQKLETALPAADAFADISMLQD